ncbi:MAG: hypothetical protein GX358_12725, partial [candidate division WS1 bacterium]|nr:hypothetical protein [candidate division WS1 bacterium]
MQSRYRMWIGLILLTIVLAFLVAFAPIRPVPREVGFDVQSTNRYSFPEPVAQDADGMEAKANEIRDTLTKAGVELDHVKFLDSSLLEVATVALTQESADQQANEVFQTLKADYPGLQKAEEEIAAETVEQPIFTVGTVFAVYPPKPQIRLGLDLQGGAHVLLRCVPETKIPFSTPEHQPMAITQALMDTPKEDRPTTTSDGKPITYPSFTHDQLQKLVYDYLIANGVDEQGLQVTVAGNNQLLIHTEAREQREVDVQLKLAQGFVERTFPTLEVSVGSVESVFVEPGTAETVKNIIDRRLYSMSDIREPIVQKQGDDKIIVELPGVKDPDRVLEILQSTAMLEFRLVPARYTPTSADQDDYGEWADSRTNQSVAWEQVMLESDLAFSGRDLMSNAEVSPDPAGQWVVNFELKAEKKREFLEFTRQNVGRLMAIVLDGQCQMAPNIRGPIPG